LFPPLLFLGALCRRKFGNSEGRGEMLGPGGVARVMATAGCVSAARAAPLKMLGRPERKGVRGQSPLPKTRQPPNASRQTPNAKRQTPNAKREGENALGLTFAQRGTTLSRTRYQGRQRGQIEYSWTLASSRNFALSWETAV
jgi:hypothetical protein